MGTGGIAALRDAAFAAEPVAWRLRGSERLDFTRRETASLLGLSLEQARDLAESGRLATVRRGRRIPLVSILEFLGVTPRDARVAEVDGQPRLALTTRDAAIWLGMNPVLLRRDLGRRGLPAGWTGKAHVIPISTVLALGKDDDTQAA